MLNFDNTHKIRLEAQKLQHLLNVPTGNEKQLYNIGDVIITSNKSPYKLNKAVIADTYKQNGYCYYIVKYNESKRRVNTLTLRQKDIGGLV